MRLVLEQLQARKPDSFGRLNIPKNLTKINTQIYVFLNTDAFETQKPVFRSPLEHRELTYYQL